jgi:sulfite reductase alpha subunit-like flavoprotein
MLERNATLLKVAALANKDAVSRRELEMVAQQVKLATGGTDCNLIGKVECGFYCTATTADCVIVTMDKINAVIQFIAELALDIVLAVSTGGAGNVAMAGMKTARSAGMRAMKATLTRVSRTSVTKVCQYGAKAMKNMVKRNVVSFVKKVGSPKFARSTVLRYAEDLKDLKHVVKHADDIELDTAVREMRKEVKDHMQEEIAKTVATLSCETIIEETMSEAKEDPDWVNEPEYRWGNMEDFGGFLEVMDITGVVSLVGAFHESDCPAVWPGNAPKLSCPR